MSKTKTIFKRVLVGLLGLMVLLILGVILFVKDFTVQLSETEAQSSIDAMIAEGPINRFGVELSVNKMKIDFKADNTMALQADFNSTAFGYSGHVKGDFSSGIRYTAPRLYLDNVQATDMDITADTETKSELSELKSSARKFLQRQHSRLESEKSKDALEKIIGETDADFQNSITKATYAFFENIPIYDLNNAGYKGSLASLALKDISFNEDHAIVTLSPAQAILKILMYITIALLIIGFFILIAILENGFWDFLFRDKTPKKDVED